MPHTPQSSLPSKNIVLARETTSIRNSSILPLTEAHRHIKWLGAEKAEDSAKIIALATMLDSIAGDTKALEFIESNSELSFADKENKNLGSIFPRIPMDLAEIEGIIYDAVDAITGIISKLSDLLGQGEDQLKRIIFILGEFVSKLQKTLQDTALKVYMHTKIEMIIRNQNALRAA